MTLDWNARKELLDFAHRWPWVFLAFFIGSLLGWAAGYVLPSPHRAEFELYVAYNGDSIYRNPDDYKNWQLGELELYIYSDEVIEAALAALRAGSSAWNGVNVAQVRPHLHTYWRNAGKWRLVAEWDDPAQTAALAQAWGQAVLQSATSAIQHSRQALALGDQARAVVRDQAALQQRRIVVSQASQALSGWLEADSPAGAAASLPILERWRLLSFSAGLAQGNPASLAVLQRFPPESAPRESYRQWALEAQAAAQAELDVLQSQAQELEALHAGYLQRWEAETAASRNLTVDLTIESITSQLLEPYALRPSGLTSLVGGVLGLLAWALIWLGRNRAGKPQ